MIETEKKEERVLLIGVELQGMDNQVTFYQIGEPGVQNRILSQIEEFLND